MEETINLLRTIINSHAFQKMPEWNEKGEFIADAKVAVEIIREVISSLRNSYEKEHGIFYHIRLVEHATDRIDEMIKGTRDFNKKDLYIFYHFIDDTIEDMIIAPKYYGL